MMTAMLTVENIAAGARIYNIWNVNEDAEYHEAGDEGQQQGIAKVTEGQAAALLSDRDVPKRIAVGAASDEGAGKISRAA
jgi:hypothetical protein